MAHYALNHRKFLEESEWRYLEATLMPRLSAPNRYERRDALIILIGLRTGARACEILRLKRADFQLKRRTIFVTGAKGSKDRELTVPDYLSQAIDNYLRDRPELTERIFPVKYMTVMRAWHLYRPNKERGFHSLRHTFGLNVYKKTKDIRLVQYALGHKAISNTMIYVDYVYSQSEMRKVIF